MSTEMPEQPPLAHRAPTRLEIHEDVRVDEFFWLRNRQDPAVLAYLTAENEYTAAAMRHTERLQQQLLQELRARIQEDDSSVPDQIDDYFYYERTIAGQQYPIYCRRLGNMEAAEEILLDVNQLAAGQRFAYVANVEVSPDHHWLAYSFDAAGDETYTLFIKDLRTGELLSEQIPNTYYGLAWGNDSRTLYYTVLDEAKRPFQVYRHRLSTPIERDELLISEADPRYGVSLRKSKSQALILIRIKSNTTAEEWFVAADDASAQPQLIAARRQGIDYSVTDHADHFFITTNDDALNFRIMVAPIAQPERAAWQTWLPHDPAVLRQATEAFREHLVIYEREAGLRHLRVVNLSTQESIRIPLPEAVYTVSRQANPNGNSPFFRFGYESLVTPATVYEYEFASQTLHVRKQTQVHHYDATRYQTLRLWATADDGTQVPISLLARRTLQLDGNNPLLLRGYGAYGASSDVHFDSNAISLLERGFVIAIAHIRGGSELGRAWYEAGKLGAKKNTFTDFICCAEYLIEQGYTSPRQLVILGRSAGGLLMGAVTNMRPDLFAGVIAGVPFVDILSTMLDPTIPLTAQEYEEWGDPNDPVQYAYMRSYSPYDNIEDKAYPQLLITAGLNDPRVQYWEPAKWVARLRTLQQNPNRVLLSTNMAAGHGGASGRFDHLHEIAFEYAFLLDVVGRLEA